MAFVYRSNRNTHKRPVTPSPSTKFIYSDAYRPESSYLYHKNNITTTFVDRTNREIWKNQGTPGPG